MDIVQKMGLFWTVLLQVEALVDAYLTVRVIQAKGRELNPVLNDLDNLLHELGWKAKYGFLVVSKLAFCLLVAYLYWRGYVRSSLDVGLIAVICIGMLLLCSHNYEELQKAKSRP